MAIGAVISQGPRLGNKTGVAVMSAENDWITVNGDLKTARANASDLLRPSAVVASQVHWVRTKGARYVMVRYAYTGSAGTPVVRLYGGYSASGLLEQGQGNFSETTTDSYYGTYVRLDNTDQNAAGITLTAANPFTDGTIKRSNPYAISSAFALFELFGAPYFTMLCETADGTATTSWGEALFL